jgi:hypothetical protein
MPVSGSANGRGKKVKILFQRNEAHSNGEGVGDATKDVRGISDRSESTLLGSRSDGTEELFGEYACRREGEVTAGISSRSGKGEPGGRGNTPDIAKTDDSKYNNCAPFSDTNPFLVFCFQQSFKLQVTFPSMGHLEPARKRAKTASFSPDIMILRKSLREMENQNFEEKQLISILKSKHNYFKFLIKRVTRRVKVWTSKIEKKERKLR